jgi:hypothetical protein
MGAGNLAREKAMKRTLLVLAAVAMFGGGCRMLAHMQQSAFFSRFVLDRSVKATDYKGIDSTRGAGGGGGIGGTTGGIGPGGADVHSSSTSTASFTMKEEGENKFKESEFIDALASQIKKEIEESRASITGSGSPASSEFYVDYKDGNIKGRITISGSASGQSYVLKANVDESNKP